MHVHDWLDSNREREHVPVVNQPISRLGDIAPEKSWVEALTRRMGCECPDDVFEEIRVRDLSAQGLDYSLEIGRRLLVGLMPAEKVNQAEATLRQGHGIRNREGLNRFRLVLVGRVADVDLRRLERVASNLDDRIHVHVLSEESLSELVAGSFPPA
jgi:hypothetical protein